MRDDFINKLNNTISVQDHLKEICEKISKNLVNTELREIFNNSCFLAGGAIRNLKIDKPINDYDFYFTNKKDAERFFEIISNCLGGSKRFIKGRWVSDPNKVFSNMDYFKLDLKCKTKNAHTFNLQNKYKIQFMDSKFSGRPDLIVSRFDFTNCMGYYLVGKDELVIYDEMETSIKTKELVFNQSCFQPLNSIKRALKFQTLGFKLTEKSFLDISKALVGRFTEKELEKAISKESTNSDDLN